jgi:hypothetical protein
VGMADRLPTVTSAADRRVEVMPRRYTVATTT